MSNPVDDNYAIVYLWLVISCVYTTLLSISAFSVIFIIRKRRSSILKSQRPARTPFSELEFNVATPTDTAKSRRVSFSRRTGVAEFVTNEATTTWKNFYEEHNKSLESSNNESGASRQTVEHLGKRIFDQQFEEVDAADLIDSIHPNSNESLKNINFAEQLESTSDGKVTAPSNKFELSDFTEKQSKIFGNDFSVPNIGEMSGKIDINFSAINMVKDDLDEIQKDLERGSNNVVCSGPFSKRQSMSEYIEVDLNSTHVVIQNEQSDMSITDTIHSPRVQDVSKSTSIDKKVSLNQDWVADKENIAINPYAAPEESLNFAINEEPDQVLVFDGKRLTIQSEKAENKSKETVLHKETERPQRKTIVLNINDDLPNFVDDMLNSKCDNSTFANSFDNHRSFSKPKTFDNTANNNISITQSVPIKHNKRHRTVVYDNDNNISITQSLPGKIISKNNSQEKRRTILYDNEECDMSVTKAIPTNIVTSNDIPNRRNTIVFDESQGNISMTQSVPTKIISQAQEKRKTIMFDENNCDISVTKAIPAVIMEKNYVSKTPSNFDESKSNMSVTQAIPTNIIIPQKDVEKRKTIVFDDQQDNISFTQAIPSNILSQKASDSQKRKTILFDNDEGNISMTQAIPLNLLIPQRDLESDSKISNEKGDISITQALPTKILQQENAPSAVINEALSAKIPLEFPEKRQTIVFENNDGDISITQSLNTNVILSHQIANQKQSDSAVAIPMPSKLSENTSDKRKTIVFEDDNGDISMTQVIPSYILASQQNKRKTIVYDDDDNVSLTQALPPNILSDRDRISSNEYVPVLTNIMNHEPESCRNVLTQSLSPNKLVTEKESEIYNFNFEDSQSNISLPQKLSLTNMNQEIRSQEFIDNVETTKSSKSPSKRISVAYDSDENNISSTRLNQESMKTSNENQDKISGSESKSNSDNVFLLEEIESNELNNSSSEEILQGKISGKIHGDGDVEMAIPENVSKLHDFLTSDLHKSGILDKSPTKPIPANLKEIQEILLNNQDDKIVPSIISNKLVYQAQTNLNLMDNQLEPSEKSDNETKSVTSSEVHSVSLKEETSLKELMKQGSVSASNSLNVVESNTELASAKTFENTENSSNAEKSSVAVLENLLDMSADSIDIVKSEARVKFKDASIGSMCVDIVDKEQQIGSSFRRQEGLFFITQDTDDDSESAKKNANKSKKKSLSFRESEKNKSKQDNDESEAQKTSPKKLSKMAQLSQKLLNKSPILNKRKSNKVDESDTQNNSLDEITNEQNSREHSEDNTSENKPEPITVDSSENIADLKNIINKINSDEKSIRDEEDETYKSRILESQSISKVANNTKELLEMISNFTDQTKWDDNDLSPVKEKESLIPQNKVESTVASLASQRQSMVMSREELYNNISMAQALLTSKVLDDTADIPTEDTIDETGDNTRDRSARGSNEVVKTLTFDESFSSDRPESSAIKKTVFGETSYMKDNKSKVIPTFLKDVSDGMKSIMLDLTKPAADVLPFDPRVMYPKDLVKKRSTCSTSLQANLLSSSQIDLDPELRYNRKSVEHISWTSYTRPCEQASLTSYGIPIDQQTSITNAKPIDQETSVTSDIKDPIKNTALSDEPSDTSKQYVQPKESDEVLVFDEFNPINNIKLGPIDFRNVHQYTPAVSNDGSRPVYNFNNSEGLAESGSDIQYTRDTNMQSQTDFLSSDPSREPSYQDTKEGYKDNQVNTVIAMRENNVLLQTTSSLTLVDEPISRPRKILFNDQVIDKPHKSMRLKSPLRAIIRRHVTIKANRAETSLTSSDDIDQAHSSKSKKRIFSPNQKKGHKNLDSSPNQANKLQKISNSPRVRTSTKATSKSDYKFDNNVILQQLITEYSRHSLNNSKPGVNLQCSDVINPTSIIALDDCKSIDAFGSFNSSKNLHNSSQCLTNVVAKLEWQADGTSLSSAECSQEVNVAAKINMLPFIDSDECRWESTTGDMWSFLLLHGRLHLTIRFDTRHDTATDKVIPDTPVKDVSVEIVEFDKRSNVAALCVRFACESINHILSRWRDTARARNVPSLLKRCAAVSRLAVKWGVAMHDARQRLAYNLDSDGNLSLKVANVPLRSVWEVRARVALRVGECGAPHPRASDVRVSRVLSDVRVHEHDVRRALGALPDDWGHAPRTIWRIFRYLKSRRQDADHLFGA